jgi:hypothetical protein
MTLANNMHSFNQGFRPCTSRSEEEHDQSDQCTTFLADFLETFFPEKKEILQLRYVGSHTIFIYSADVEIFIKLF